MDYSELQVFSLNEGYFSVGLDKVFIPSNPLDVRIPKTLFVAIHPFLILGPDENLLIDCGLGGEAKGRTIAHLTDQLDRRGVQREDIDKVLLSHLHFDHIGGATFLLHGERIPTFPNAAYYIQRNEIDAAYEGQSARFRDTTLEVLDREGQLVLLEGDSEITPSIQARVTGGHTEFHQSFLITSQGRGILFGGDVLPQPAQVNSKFKAKYDVNPEQSARARRLMAEEALENGYLVLFYHATGTPAAYISAYDDRTGFALEKLSLTTAEG